MQGYRIVARRDGRDVWRELDRFGSAIDAGREYAWMVGAQLPFYAIAEGLDAGQVFAGVSVATGREVRVERVEVSS